MIVCRVQSPDRVAHVMKGMIRPFEVVAADKAAAREFPTASDTITLADYAFAGRPLTAGRHTILVENAGPQPHELVLLKLAAGKTPVEFAKWGLGGRKGPPPAVPIGGVEFLDNGGRGLFSVDLSPGAYRFICFVPDVKDGRRHFALGMMKQFQVQ